MDQKKFPKLQLKSELRMPAEKVVQLYQLFENNGVEVWVDGGWGVDALLEEQTREHADLDIAVEHKYESKLLELLGLRDYKVVKTNDKTDWVYVMSDGQNEVDVHVFGFDKDDNNVYGTKYPKDSLTGTGKINGQTVRCISPEWMVKFHTRYELAITDVHDVKALCAKFKIPLPDKFKT
jgi:lincosamide nucleotidyltransferase A/C/D/E